MFIAYNRLLGFDHIYMFYRPEMTEVPRFEELKSLPYVTLTLNEDGTRVNYYNQWQTEILCLSEQKYAAKYDWALLADIDEYLWFAERIGIKEFLTRPSSQNLTYISFAKRMYTLDHRTDMQTVNHTIDMSSKSSDNFALSKYPFYIDHFCFHKGHRRGDPICPTWRGRSKVIVRPQFHTVMDTHGTIKQPDPANGTIHLSSEQAHFMEWPEIFAKHNVTKRDPVDFFVQTEDQVHIHNLQLAFKADATGNLRMQYDDKLEDWFRFVMGRYSAGP